MNFKMECNVRPKYPIYIAVRDLDAQTKSGTILVSEDGQQWSNPTLSGSPRAFGPGEIKQISSNGDIAELSEYLKDCPWVKWELVE